MAAGIEVTFVSVTQVVLLRLGRSTDFSYNFSCAKRNFKRNTNFNSTSRLIKFLHRVIYTFIRAVVLGGIGEYF